MAAPDLLVYISVREDPLFKRSDDDVYYELPITHAQAAPSDSIVVPTADSKIKLKIPEGTQNGKVFRLKGQVLMSMACVGRSVYHHVEVLRKLNRINVRP